MGQRVDIDDLIDANDVADLLGLAHRNTVSVYQHRYPDMPRPVLDFGNGRVKVWLKPDVERWQPHRRRAVAPVRPVVSAGDLAPTISQHELGRRGPKGEDV